MLLLTTKIARLAAVHIIIYHSK